MTAPRSWTAPSSTRRFPPGPNPADAIPPAMGRRGCAALRASSTASVGKVWPDRPAAGPPLPLRRRAPSMPVSVMPFPVSGHVDVVGGHRAGGAGPQGDTGGVPPTSSRPARTDTAVAPTRVPGVQQRPHRGRRCPSITPTWARVTNSTARSGGPSRRSSSSPTTSPVAWVASGLLGDRSGEGHDQATGGRSVYGDHGHHSHVDPASEPPRCRTPRRSARHAPRR